MEFPTISKKKCRRVSVAGFDGGINGSDAAWRVCDNQLTDALNLWWMAGALRTRPGVKPLPDTLFDEGGTTVTALSGGGGDVSTADGYARKLARIVQRQEGSTAMVDAVMSTIRYDGSESRSTIRAGMTAGECAGLLLAESGGGTWSGTASNCAVTFIGQGGTEAGGRILAEPSDSGASWVDIAAQAYVPLVMVNGQGSATLEEAQSPGTMYEGYNLLTPKFRVQFTTTGEAARFYFLPVKQLDNAEVIVRFTEADGTMYSYTIPAGSEASATDAGGIAMHVNRTGGYIYCVQTEFNAIRWFTATGIKNNLEVIASKTRSEGRDKICSMRFCTWFGGDRSGYNGGTRLFVSGHPQMPNLVHWSDVNNLLYYPENNYAYIGDAGQAVTAFAKQGDKLIIFKEREMYSATYTAGSRTSQSLPDGTVIDATANAAHFPVAQLHPFIGCDCPGTIQLCDNRLVWADSGGKVYVLAGANQYSESNVRTISGAIGQWLGEKAGQPLRDACSGDYRGHYVLVIGCELFVFDYTDTNYIAYAQSTAKSRAQSAIPWMRWFLDSGFVPEFIMTNGEKMVLGGKTAIEGASGRIHAVLGNDEDERLVMQTGVLQTEAVSISCMLQTKLFDFEEPERYKDVPQLYLELECGKDTVVTADYCTEQGETGDAMPVELPETGGLLRLMSHAIGVRCFGLRLQSLGTMAVGGITWNVRVYGKGVR